MDFAQTLPAMFKIASFPPFYPQNASPAFHWWKVWLIKLLSKKAPPSISTVPSRVSQRPCARGQISDATIKCVQVKKKLVLSNSRGNEGICSNSGPICCCDLRELKGFFDCSVHSCEKTAGLGTKSSPYISVYEHITSHFCWKQKPLSLLQETDYY